MTKKSTEYSLRWRLKNPEHWLWAIARARALKRGMEFSIAEADVIIPKTCPILGLELVPSGAAAGKTRKPRNNAPSLDRIDNTKGYIPGNVRVVSWRANNLKSDASLEELEALVAFLKDK